MEDSELGSVDSMKEDSQSPPPPPLHPSPLPLHPSPLPLPQGGQGGCTIRHSATLYTVGLYHPSTGSTCHDFKQCIQHLCDHLRQAEGSFRSVSPPPLPLSLYLLLRLLLHLLLFLLLLLLNSTSITCGYSLTNTSVQQEPVGSTALTSSSRVHNS